MRHSYDTGKNQGAIHMVSAWASQNRLVLGQVKVGEKSNEITAIPKLLKIVDAQLWSGLKRVGLIESERRIKGQLPTIERRYYLLSLDGGVERFAQAVRSHWGIENQLHWCLDVAFNEDDSRKDLSASIRSGHAPENIALIRHIALNLLSKETSFKAGKKAKRLKAGWDNDYLAKVLTT